MVWLTLAFLATAFVYAAVGFGGGSTYTALLVLGEADYRLIPVVSLLCNVAVVIGGVSTFARAGWLDTRLALPLAVTSVPLAWLGGTTTVARGEFLLLLGLLLSLAGALLLLRDTGARLDDEIPVATTRSWLIGPTVGGAIGYVSGLVGIGGGIFLAPVLHLARVAPPRTIAATASLFILLNSLAALGGQAYKLRASGLTAELAPYGWLLIAVVAGGQLGSRTGLRLLSGPTLRRLTGLLVLSVGARVLILWQNS